MAKVEYGSITVTGTGNDIIVLNDSTLDVQKVVLFVASSSTEASAGFSDGTIKFTGGSAYGDENDTKTLTHYRNVSGTKTKVFETDVTNMDVGEFTINTTTCTQITTLRLVAYGT